MKELSLFAKPGAPLRVMCVGAHCDDIEIGCGASLVELQGAGRIAAVDWIILSGSVERQAESRAAMAALVGPAARGKLLFGDFPDGRLPGVYGAVKTFFEALKDLPAPDVLFTHERDDRHQDHRLVNEMTWSTFRDSLVLEYEVPKWDGGLGQPGLYVPVSREAADRKIDALLAHHASQRSRHWFTRDTFEALLRLRGLECRSPSGLAEAFHARKLVLASGPG